MQIQDQFPPLKNSTYLNTPTSCLLAQEVLDWRSAHDEAFHQKGFSFRDESESLLKGVKQSLANFFHADSSNTFLIPNFSFGFNTLLQGLSSSERFLLLQEDYPSVNYSVERNGFTCSYVQVSASLEDDILEKINVFKPTVFAFSLVQYISGIKLDFEFIKRLKTQYPEILLVADGTQFCGTAAFDFNASGLDVLASSGYKWMMAGYGNGFIFLSEQVKPRLFNRAKNQQTPSESFLRDKGIFSLCFEPGHQDTLVYGTLQQSVNLLTKIGIQAIQETVTKLSIQAKAAFATRGLLPEEVLKRKQHSSIFNLAISETGYQHLQEEGIICVRRGTGVRVGFHFFNTENDLAKLLQVLDLNT